LNYNILSVFAFSNADFGLKFDPYSILALEWMLYECGTYESRKTKKAIRFPEWLFIIYYPDEGTNCFVQRSFLRQDDKQDYLFNTMRFTKTSPFISAFRKYVPLAADVKEIGKEVY
jgi:hypothetical protein